MSVEVLRLLYQVVHTKQRSLLIAQTGICLHVVSDSLPMSLCLEVSLHIVSVRHRTLCGEILVLTL